MWPGKSTKIRNKNETLAELVNEYALNSDRCPSRTKAGKPRIAFAVSLLTLESKGTRAIC